MVRSSYRSSKKSLFHPYKQQPANLLQNSDQSSLYNSTEPRAYGTCADVENYAENSETDEADEVTSIVIELDSDEDNRMNFDEEEYDEEEYDEEESDEMESDKEESEAEESEGEEADEIEEDYITLRSVSKSTSEVALLAVLGSLFSRETYLDFQLRVDAHDDFIKQQAEKLYCHIKSKLSKLFLCNDCGCSVEKDSQCCKGVIAEVLRVPMTDQLDDLLIKHYEAIVELRLKLKNGQVLNHNLEGSVFRQRWRSEKKEELNLSLVLSIDGVRVVGKGSKKIWPMSCVVVDLPSEVMIKSENIILSAIVLCDANPSTFVWNKVWSTTNTALEKLQFNTENHVVSFEISTTVADQPAKRSLFGMKNFHSVESCFYCLSTDTMYKLDGPDRELRGKQQTADDNFSKQHGFRFYATIVSKLMPYDAIVDVFHNVAEGIFPVIMNEAHSNDVNDRKTDLFVCNKEKFSNIEENLKIPSKFKDAHTLRNGTAKFDHFRISYFFNAICSTSFTPLARMIIVGFGLLANIMSTNSGFSSEFVARVCECIDKLMKIKFHKYYTIKLHETLYHLPKSCEKYGNVAMLSTSMFETFYRVLLSDVKKSMIHNFIDFSAHRFVSQTAVYREVEERLKNGNCSKKTVEFVRHSRKFIIHKSGFVHKFNRLLVGLRDQKTHCFAIVRTTVGHFKSQIVFPDSTDDVIFFKHRIYKCGQFLYAYKTKNIRKIVVQVMEEKDKSFKKMKKCVEMLDSNEKQYAEELLSDLTNCSFVCNGIFNGKKIEIELEDITGIGCALQSQRDVVAIQLTGAAVHA